MQDLSGAQQQDISGSYPNPPTIPPPPPTISLEELLNEISLVQKKESDDREQFFAIFDRPIEQLRARLVEWAKQGLPDMFALDSFVVNPPTVCSDGQIRTVIPYVEYITGKTMTELLELTQNKVTNINILFSYSGNRVTLYCGKP